jgi:general secretion pathway protein G
MTQTKTARGFTLIELLVVIAIIGVLSSIVIASLSAARNKGNDAKRLADLSSVQTALELYYGQHGYTYPSVSGWRSQCSTWGGYASANDIIPGLAPDYLPKIPADPQMNTASNVCCYLYYSNGVDYKFLAHNCPSSNVCYGSGEATGGFPDPVRPTWACTVYSTSVSGQSW